MNSEIKGGDEKVESKKAGLALNREFPSTRVSSGVRRWWNTRVGRELVNSGLTGQIPVFAYSLYGWLVICVDRRCFYQAPSTSITLLLLLCWGDVAVFAGFATQDGCNSPYTSCTFCTAWHARRRYTTMLFTRRERPICRIDRQYARKSDIW